MDLIEYKVVNPEGSVINTVLLPENQTAPENHFLPWGDRGFFMPKWDFERGDWIETLTAEEIAVKEQEIIEYQSQPSAEEMNAMAIMELTNLVLGG